MLVVISTLLSYLYAIEGNAVFSNLLYLGLFGFFITGAANAFNQVIERELDAKMDRTKNRPLPSETLFPKESAIYGSVLLFVGLLGLTLVFNPLAAGLSFISFALYVFLYTPLKSRTPLAVLVGAFPGALPILVGCVAASGQFFPDYLLLFSIQFFWQFPHFWAIAWVLDEDYQKAGFRLLPFGRGKDAFSAYYMFIYTVALVLVSLFPVFLQLAGIWYFGFAISMGFGFLAVTLIHLRKLSSKSARQVMFYSFIYLPVVQLLLALDKI
jgi:protoheme IX farnesyltransferase